MIRGLPKILGIAGLWLPAAALCGLAVLLMHQRRRQFLPYHDSFARGWAAEWTPYGGAWQLKGDEVLNRSDESGAKLVTGSPGWTNYQVTTDLKLVGHGGDVGVMVRVRDEDRGIDSYNGYYIGLRSEDSALILGRADFGWMESPPAPIQGGIESGAWYRLRVVAVGCDIGAEVTRLGSGQKSWAAFHEPSCVTSGKIGLRSMGTGGAWRNIIVQRATEPDLQAIRAHVAFTGEPVYPFREADYNAMREKYFASNHLAPSGGLNFADPLSAKQPPPAPPIDAIASVRSTTLPSPVTLRGTVTLISPLYVQDPTGGIAVSFDRPLALNLGDEVQIEGTPAVSSFASRLEASRIRLLWDRSPVLPISLTTTQAATGAFDSSLIELSGVLRSKSIGPGGLISLVLYDSAQTFHALLRGSISTEKYESLSAGSRLRVTGICLAPPSPGKDAAGFTILLRSMEDVQVLAGPPWWTGRQLRMLMLAAFALLALGVVVYLRLEQAKMRAILSERERLAHEMHDTLAQSFAGVGFHLQGMRSSMRSGRFDAESMLGKLDTACDLVAHTHREASASIAALHPAEDGQLELLAALERCARSMLDSGDLPLSFFGEGSPRPISLPVRDALFQIGREGIANALRHSGATRILVTLRYGSKTVMLQVADNGRGFARNPEANGFGIRTMHRRAKDTGALLTIETEDGSGAVLNVTAPYGSTLTLAGWLKPQWAAAVRYMKQRVWPSRPARAAADKY